MNLKIKANKFEERTAVKIIIERIIKALLKSKIFYSSKLIYSHGLASGIPSLSIFLLMRSEGLLSAGVTKYLVLKKCFYFSQEICFSFFTNGVCKF